MNDNSVPRAVAGSAARGFDGFQSLIYVIAFLTGAFFTPAALIAAAYVLFLAFAFHGPSHWAGNQAEFGSFVNHFTFIAGLLFAAVHGAGSVLASKLGRV